MSLAVARNVLLILCRAHILVSIIIGAYCYCFFLSFTVALTFTADRASAG